MAQFGAPLPPLRIVLGRKKEGDLRHMGDKNVVLLCWRADLDACVSHDGGSSCHSMGKILGHLGCECVESCALSMPCACRSLDHCAMRWTCQLGMDHLLVPGRASQDSAI